MPSRPQVIIWVCPFCGEPAQLDHLYLEDGVASEVLRCGTCQKPALYVRLEAAEETE
jgi:hypothetical protein